MGIEECWRPHYRILTQPGSSYIYGRNAFVHRRSRPYVHSLPISGCLCVLKSIQVRKQTTEEQ